MTRPPATVAGKALHDRYHEDSADHSGCSLNQRIADVEREAREALEARLAEAERLLRQADSLIEDEWIGTGYTSVGNEWLRQARAALAAAPEQPPDWKEIGHTYGLTPTATGGLDVPTLAEALNATVGNGWARSTPEDGPTEWLVNAERVAREYDRRAATLAGGEDDTAQRYLDQIDPPPAAGSDR